MAPKTNQQIFAIMLDLSTNFHKNQFKSCVINRLTKNKLSANCKINKEYTICILKNKIKIVILKLEPHFAQSFTYKFFQTKTSQQNVKRSIIVPWINVLSDIVVKSGSNIFL